MSPAFRTLVSSSFGVLSFCSFSLQSAAADPSPSPSEAIACSYPGLVSEIPVGISTTPSYFWVEQPENYWMAVAIRPQAGTDWDIGLYDTTAASPGCVSGLLAASAAAGSAVDFVVGDYNWFDPFAFPHNEYVLATRFSGTGTAVLEWDDADDGTLPNFPPYTGSLSANDILDVFDLHMYAGIEHTIILNLTGSADINLMIFENPGSGGYWAPRTARVFEMGSGGTATFTPALTGYHGVALVNDNGLSGTYSLEVRACVPPIALPSEGGGYFVDSVYTWYSFNQQSPAWSAVAVGEPPTADWDLAVYQSGSGGPWPICFSSMLALSQDVGRTDIVVGDFNHNPLGTYYARPYIFSGAGTGALVWDDGDDALALNAPLTYRSAGDGEVLEAWDTSLIGGITYTFEFYGGGPAGLHRKLLLFRNPGASTFWGNRAGAQFEVPVGNMISYTAPVTDDYGVVVVNDTSAAGEFLVGVRSCTLQGLASGVSVPTTPVTGYYNFTQATNYWSAIGVRGTGADDWDMAVYDGTSGNPWPNCLSGLRAASVDVGTVDFVVGDFNDMDQGTYYAHSMRFSGSADARSEWDDGSDALDVNASAVARSTNANDVLEVWDVLLTQGQTYYFEFNRGGSADTKLLLFKSNSNTYWAPRSMRILETASTLTSFVAPATDWYGVVVVNDNGGSGTYTLRVSTSATDVASAGEAAAASELLMPAPNPSSGATQIRFRLAAPAHVAIDIVDVSGRVVAALPRRTWQAGPAETAWDGLDDSGRRIAAGIYWIRASADGREIGRQKLVIVT